MDNESLKKSFLFGFLGACACNAMLIFGVVAVIKHTDVGSWVAQNLNIQPAAASSSPVILTDSTGKADNIVSVVEKANPAVVAIVISKDVPVMEQYMQNFNPFGNGRGGFQIPQYRQNGTKKQEVGGGSGFFVSDDGYLVSNAHVVADDSAEYTVFLTDGTKYEAKMIAKDTVLDIALLKVEAKGVPYLSFGDSESLKVGQSVIAIGNALGEYRNTVSAGVVSGLARSVSASTNYGNSETLPNVIQTDAAINPGNSGGPLLDLVGHVIGVNVAASTGGAENIGFALPANAVKKAVDSIKENGRVIRPYIGVRYIPITDEVKNANDLTVDYGVLVLRGARMGDLAVVPGSPADKAGLEENDIILEINGEKVTSKTPLENMIASHSVGDKISLKIQHDGKDKTVTVTLEERKTD
ncbi:MAG: trypsin-like peptidase domain-containing protein [Patescibacteria group bacterium]|jgi:serine protease Do